MDSENAAVVEKLESLRSQFLAKAKTYQHSASYWRSKSFQVAVALGFLPLLAAAAGLIPGTFRRWYIVLVFMVNVLVIVLNVKADIGERVVGATGAGRGYEKLAERLHLFLAEHAAPSQLVTSKLLCQIMLLVDIIESNITYKVVSSFRSQRRKTAKVVDEVKTVPCPICHPVLCPTCHRTEGTAGPAVTGSAQKYEAAGEVAPSKGDTEAHTSDSKRLQDDPSHETAPSQIALRAGAPLAPEDPPSLEPPDSKVTCGLKILERKQLEFDKCCMAFNRRAKDWKNKGFLVAVVLGILPILAGSTELMPKWLRPWYALVISLVNVFIVIVNVKYEIAEKAADAGAAGRLYDKLERRLRFFLASGDTTLIAIAEVTAEIEAIVDQIKISMLYPLFGSELGATNDDGGAKKDERKSWRFHNLHPHVGGERIQTVTAGKPV